ncbi:MAG: hypothetical protein H0V09_09040 [Gemmatimonadetes bacterium]|nr:hypothetical protein [Gemmatimonadota bacterium]
MTRIHVDEVHAALLRLEPYLPRLRAARRDAAAGNPPAEAATHPSTVPAPRARAQGAIPPAPLRSLGPR